MRYFSFDTHASSYEDHAIAQRFFAQKLSRKIEHQIFDVIGELGCGSGILFDCLQESGVKFAQYVACDSSREMLGCFESEQVIKVCKDFDTFLSEEQREFSLILSSSALQWSKNLEHTLSLISQHADKVAFSIIDGKTFSSLHSYLQTTSPLLQYEQIQDLLMKFFEGELEVMRMDLSFSTPKELIAHLRGSGVMGGGVLGYSQSKKLLEYSGVLEYESVVFVGTPKIKGEK